MEYSLEERAAILSTKRIKRFTEGYDEYSDLNKLIRTYFNNKLELESTGLSIKFLELKKYVEDNHLIGLILIGTITDEIPEKYKVEILKYTTQSGKNISITINSICTCTINDYIENVKELCIKTPNFNVYYSALCEEK